MCLQIQVHMAVITMPYSNESLLLYVRILTLDACKDCRDPIRHLVGVCLEAFMATDLGKLCLGRQPCQMNYKI
jgi:hypothetical protein